MLKVPGKDFTSLHNNFPVDRNTVDKNTNEILTSSDLYSVVVDESYSVIGKHLDDNIKRRIQEGEFIDFSRLLPRDRMLALNDNRLELINNNGRPELRTVTDSENIGSFHKWEQAFRVYSTIYTDRYPERAKQLLQYNHIIFSASLTYVWNNVYAYDIDF